jgi:hypothetical protein
MQKFTSAQAFEAYVAANDLCTAADLAKARGVATHTLLAQVRRGAITPHEYVRFQGPSPMPLFKREGVLARPATLVVGDVFELAGAFTPKLVAQYERLSALTEEIKDGAEIVRCELELVVDLCTNCPSSLSEEHLEQVARFLTSKLESLR